MRPGTRYQTSRLRSLFDPEEEKKERGMRLAAEKRADLLGYARWTATIAAKTQGTVTVDDVRERIENDDDFVPGNWMGSIFKGKEWERVGYKKSTHEGSHARMISVWRLKR